GGAAVALLRMGVKLDKADAVLKAMRDGQNADGGWSEAAGPSDLGSTYRIMRCFFMLKESPDLDGLRAYLAKHRQGDGGYASKLGGASDASGAYFCTTVDRWARLLSGEPATVETAGFVPLFDGKGLDGWEGDTSLWSARDGVLIGRSKGLKQNEFLATTKSYRDFVLKLTFRLVGGEGNSGVQFRSVRVPGTEMSGYQADIGQNYWGCLYDESRRNKVLVQASKKAMEGVNKTGWNEYVLRVIGDHITLTLNGVRSVDYHEPDSEIARDGKIAVQMHAGGPIEVQFKDMYIQELPSPTLDDSVKPGFHLRTVKAEGGDRNYTVYLPEGYDGHRSFPVVLFLHGSGERGSDGVLSAQVGLGAVIPAHPENYPFIGVFPQARKTWMADSDDAKAALSTLDEVLKTYKCETNRVVLTGLSMGGSGSWSIGAAHPDRFSAIVPVCGSGDPERVGPLKDTPVWALLGDADSDRVVQSTRVMAKALRAEGGTVRETEYRGVGHNSWDRAYSDRALINWMLTQKRTAK
ncbi:MAG: family 16 glycoside hydrolase, partial [Isosphaeraceae bacterium]